MNRVDGPSTNGTPDRATDGRRPRRRWRRLAAVGAVGLVLTTGAVACGLPQDREPQTIAGGLPENLRIRENVPTSGPDRTEPQILYFVKGGDGADSTDVLYPVYRNVTVPDNPTDLPRAVLEELFKGNTDVEHDEGVSTALPANPQVLHMSQSGNTISVDISNLPNVQGPRQEVALAQIVFTLTNFPTIRDVMFLSNGSPIGVPLEGGASDPSVPVTRSSFSPLMESVDNSGLDGTSTDGPGGTVPGNRSAGS